MQEVKFKIQKALAAVIKKYRGSQSISRLSNEIGLSKSVWSDLENGKKDIQFSTLYRIAEALNVEPHKIVYDIENLLGKDFSFLE